jgi:hypothetical protein
MIRYTLKCADDHRFDGWYQSSERFDQLRAAGHISCPDCGSNAVEKTLMAPTVQLDPTVAPIKPSLSAPRNEQEAHLAELRRKVEENSEYVGMSFAVEAREIHEGNAPERSIYGEAKPEDALKLLQDGVQVAPLPFMPQRKMN